MAPILLPLSPFPYPFIFICLLILILAQFHVSQATSQGATAANGRAGAGQAARILQPVQGAVGTPGVQGTTREPEPVSSATSSRAAVERATRVQEAAHGTPGAPGAGLGAPGHVLGPPGPQARRKLGAAEFWKRYLGGEEAQRGPLRSKGRADLVVGAGVEVDPKPRVTSLAHKIHTRSLPLVHLLPAKLQQQQQQGGKRGMGLLGLLGATSGGRSGARFCRGLECPAFRTCAGQLGEVRSCWNPPLAGSQAKALGFKCPTSGTHAMEYFTILPSECKGAPPVVGAGAADSEGDAPGAWAGQVVRLHHVYLDSFGHVFNATHRFDFGGCSNPALDDTATTYKAGTRVVAVEKLLNLMHEPQLEAGVSAMGLEFEEVVLKLPLLASMSKLMHKFRTLPWAMQNRRVSAQEQMQSTWRSVAGGSLASTHLRTVQFPDLIFAKRLYVPLQPLCIKFSPALWQAVRSRHLLPPAGLPMFDPQGALRQPGTTPELTVADPLAGRMGVGPDWVVVVSYAGLRGLYAEQMAAVQVEVEALFGEARVREYEGKMPFHHAKELFNNAILLVAATGPALVNTVLLPFNATVLEISLGPRSPSQGPREVYQRLAHACGVVHFLVDCNSPKYRPRKGGASSSAGQRRLLAALRLPSSEAQNPGSAREVPAEAAAGVGASPQSRLCSVDAVREALETVQHSIFRGPWFDASLLDPRGVDFKAHVPGTLVRTAKARVAFLQWQKCVADEGKWKRNPHPRLLPWDYRGFSNYCDNRHKKVRGALVGRTADEHFRSGKPQRDWKVRPALKYVWMAPKHCGMWAPFSGERFCHSAAGLGRSGKGRSILILGDSMQEQFVRTFLNNVLLEVPKPATWAVNEHVPPECEDWIPGGGGKKLRHNFCRTYAIHSSVCRNLTITFIRNDHLQISGNERKFDRQPFVRMRQLEEADVVVLNRGAHYRDNDHFVEGLRSAVRHIRNKYPEKLIVFRSSAPGHANCTNFVRPLQEPQDPQKLPNPYREPYMWHKFAEQNALAKGVVEEVGGVFMDVDIMTRYRADGHQGLIEEINLLDCLHYCLPVRTLL